MRLRHSVFAMILAAAPLIGGCAAAIVGGAAVGAGAAHDRRSAGTYIDDKRIYLGAYDAINKDKELALKNSVIIVVYNGVMLLVGEVRTEELKQRAERLGSHRDLRVEPPGAVGFDGRHVDQYTPHMPSIETSSTRESVSITSSTSPCGATTASLRLMGCSSCAIAAVGDLS